MFPSATRAQIIAANEATFAAWNTHDPDAVAAVFAEDAVIRDAGSPVEIRGRAAIRERTVQLLAAFPDFHLERRRLLVDDGANADRWVMTGTHRGEFLGIPATGRRIEIHGATFTEFGPDGLVTEDVNYWNPNDLLTQLGAA